MHLNFSVVQIVSDRNVHLPGLSTGSDRKLKRARPCRASKRPNGCKSVGVSVTGSFLPSLWLLLLLYLPTRLSAQQPSRTPGTFVFAWLNETTQRTDTVIQYVGDQIVRWDGIDGARDERFVLDLKKAEYLRIDMRARTALIVEASYQRRLLGETDGKPPVVASKDKGSPRPALWKLAKSERAKVDDVDCMLYHLSLEVLPTSDELDLCISDSVGLWYLYELAVNPLLRAAQSPEIPEPLRILSKGALVRAMKGARQSQQPSIRLLKQDRRPVDKAAFEVPQGFSVERLRDN